MNDYLQITNLCNRVNLTTKEASQPAFILAVLTPATSLLTSWLPLNLAVVIDGRGAFTDEAMWSVKQAIKGLVEQLRPVDRLSIVVCGDPAQVILPAQKVEQLSHIYSMIDQVRNLGGINLATGLELGLEQVKQNHSPDTTDRILCLLSDQVGLDADACYDLAEQAGKLGIQFLGIGFGENWHEFFLNGLIERNLRAGSVSVSAMIEYIPSGSQQDGQALFHAHQAMQIVARKVGISMSMMSGMETREVWQVRPHISSINFETIHNQHIHFQVGDLPRDGAIFLVDAIMPGRASGDVRVARFEMDFDLPGHGSFHESSDLAITYAPSINITNPLNSDVMDCAEMIQAYRLQTQALYALENDDAQNAGYKLRQAAAILVSQGEVDLADLIRREVDYNLRKYGQISEQGKKSIRFSGRRLHKLAEWGS